MIGSVVRHLRVIRDDFEVLVVLGSHLTSTEVEKFLFKLCLSPYSEIKERKTKSKASSVSSVIRTFTLPFRGL